MINLATYIDGQCIVLGHVSKMGGRKKRLGRLSKNYEKKRQERKINPPGITTQSLTPNRLLSKVLPHGLSDNTRNMFSILS